VSRPLQKRQKRLLTATRCWPLSRMSIAAPFLRASRARIAIDDAQIGVGTVTDAIRVLSLMATPQHVVIDLSGAADPLAGIEALADVCDDGTRLIAFGDLNDIDFYRQLIGSVSTNIL
jgi:hypothetical protein